jgi:hypothetical protein
VVDAPAVEVGTDPRRMDDVGDLLVQLGQAGRLVADVV